MEGRNFALIVTNVERCVEFQSVKDL